MTNAFSKESAYGVHPATLAYRRALSAEKFAKNTRCDEYYTHRVSWERFIRDKGLAGGTYWEPFYGDGTSIRELDGLVTVEGKPGDFWDHVQDPDRPKHAVLSNPPFSFKWEIICTLAEMRTDFALILPWQTFAGWGMKQIHKMQEAYGGTWEHYKMKSKECYFYHPPAGRDVHIGCGILYVRF